MNKKRKALVTVPALCVCLCASYLVIENIPASFEKIDMDELDTNKICMTDNKNKNQTTNIIFAVDSGFISSDFNTGNTIIDTCAKIFINDFTQKNDVSVQICTFSGYSSSLTADVVSSPPLRSVDDVECYMHCIKNNFGKTRGESSSMLIPAGLAEISKQKYESVSTYVYVFTGGKHDNDTTKFCPDDSPCRDLHISYIIPSDSPADTIKYYKSLSDLFSGEVFSDYIRKDGVNNISDKISDDLCTHIALLLDGHDINQNNSQADDSVYCISDCIQQKNGGQIYTFKNEKKIMFECHEAIDHDKDGCPDEQDSFPDEYNTFYNRKKTRQHAQIAYNTLKNGQFRYLSPLNGDRATNCANYVSQCIFAGGYPMTENWYMKKYDDSTTNIKRFTDKLTSWTKSRLFESFNIGTRTSQYYTDQSYIWTNSWSCANVQAEYGEQTFFDDSFTVMDFSDVSEAVLVHGVQSGDVIYQGIDDKHHVLMITDVSDDGTLFVSSHNPPKYQEKVDEAFWEKGGFGQVVIYKVKDIIK